MGQLELFKQEIDQAFEHYKELYLEELPSVLNPHVLYIIELQKYEGKFSTVSDYFMVRAKAAGAEKAILKKMESYTAKKVQEFYDLPA